MKNMLIICLIVLCAIGTIFSQSIVFTKGTKLNVKRMGAANVLLNDGRFLLVGGHTTGFVRLNTAEIYDPTTNTFTQYTMKEYRDGATVVKLANGKVLVTGGCSADWGVGQLTSAEIFDPVSNTFTLTGSMNLPRVSSYGALLSNNNVLIAGCWYSDTAANYAEVFNTSTNTFSLTGKVVTKRSNPFITTTNDGNALIFGGYPNFGSGLFPQDIELYNTGVNSFSSNQASIFGDSNQWLTAFDYYTDDPAMFKMKNGKSIYLARKDSVDRTMFRLYTVDPVTKQVQMLQPTTPLPNYYPAGGDSLYFYQPVVDTAKNLVYIMAYRPAGFGTRYVLCTYNPVDNSFKMYKNYPYSCLYYIVNAAFSVLKDGRILIAGGNTSNNFDPVDGTIIISANLTDVKEEVTKPAQFSLEQNYPNPFNPATKIVYTLKEKSDVILKVFDILGRNHETIVNAQQNAGRYEVNFNASKYESGVYFYTIRAGNFTETRKMLLLK